MAQVSKSGFLLRPCRQVRWYSAPTDRSVPVRKQKYVPDSGIYPKGFLVSGTHVGVKPGSSKPDLALLVSQEPCKAAAVFTRNRIKAAPIRASGKLLSDTGGEGVRSVLINSGCANAVTGEGGLRDAHDMADKVKACLPPCSDGSTGNGTLVMSTGVIGQRLPIQKIVDGVPEAISALDDSHDSWLKTAWAICTTDTFPKLLSSTFSLPSSPGITYSIAGMTKGAGMIHPNMATLLGILCTDIPIESEILQKTLRAAVQSSFNCISIDGDTSTNDTVALLANGAAGGNKITELESQDGQAFLAVCTNFARSLAQLVVRDGEGATKFIHLHVKNASTRDSANIVAKSVVVSPLVKTAMYGQDANWGRILCAIGNAHQEKSENHFSPDRVSVAFVDRDGAALSLLVNGEPQEVNEDRAKIILQEEEINIEIDLGGGAKNDGKASTDFWFCDLSHGVYQLLTTIEKQTNLLSEYISINADYRS